MSDEEEDFNVTIPETGRQWLATVSATELTGDLKLRTTVQPPTARDARGLRAIASIEKLAPAKRLEIGDLIGEGGMSVVRAGRQLALGREVAVKTTKASDRDGLAALGILREAWVTGALEHPNIVPVHDIEVDVSGRPQIVLRRIAGAAWSEVMHDEEALRERYGVRDVLDWNIRTLMQVCNGVHFAHSRGVLHRDLKSDNVMIGSFGEVYVLDWGLAVALTDDGTGRLPLASDVDAVAGTPAYLAPEMLDANGARLGPRTDVYLLGAILYEVVAGWPPHLAPTIDEVVKKVMRSMPLIPADTPKELTGIIRKALAREPADRYESAEALRLALAGFLEHRASIGLATDAFDKLDELEMTSRGGPFEQRRLRAYHLFGECRFGFREALRAWPGNENARTGLHRAVIHMVNLELAGGDPRAAQLLLLELEDAPPELKRSVDAAAKARRDEDKKRSMMMRDLDPRIGRKTRLVISAAFGVFWTALPIAGFFVERATPKPDQLPPLISSVVSLGIASAIAHRARASLSRTALNRSIVRALGVVLAAQIGLYAATYALGVSYEHTRVLVLVLYATCSAQFAASIEQRLWPTALTYAAIAALACVWPPMAWPLEAVANAVLTANVLVIWRSATDPDDPAPPP